MNDSVIYKNHEIKILNREILSLTGIKKILNFDNSEFILSSVMGDIYIKGKDLEVLLLDTDKGEVRINGKVNSVVYSDTKNKDKESFIDKLFKW